jgi:hypothetical protein
VLRLKFSLLWTDDHALAPVCAAAGKYSRKAIKKSPSTFCYDIDDWQNYKRQIAQFCGMPRPPNLLETLFLTPTGEISLTAFTFLNFFLGNTIQARIIATTLVRSMWGNKLRECG